MKRWLGVFALAPFLALAQIPFFVGKHVEAQGGITLAEVYPVGSVYISVTSTDPAITFGIGTWQQIGGGRVLVGQTGGDADFDTAEETGGTKTVSSAGSNSAPTFTGSALGTHAHATGTYATSAHAGSAVADHAAHTHSVTSNVSIDNHGSHTHDYTQIVNHTHPVTDPGHTHTIPVGATDDTSAPFDRADAGTNAAGANATTETGSKVTGVTTTNPAGGVATGTTAGPGATLTHTANNPAVTSGNPSAALTHGVTQPSAHTLSGSSEAVSAGTPAGTVGAPTFTGSATSVVQPYLVVYVWKRTE